jgi:regulator of RNase E activity RraA
MWDALAQMPSPAVIVMQDVSGAPHRCAYAGEVMATLAQRLGAVGMVSDGGYRDLDEVKALGFHYFAPFAVVSHGNFAIQDVGQPVWIDGQRVKTGDILHGDANGIVIVPDETLNGLPDAVEEIRVRERRVTCKIAQSRPGAGRIGGCCRAPAAARPDGKRCRLRANKEPRTDAERA